MLYTDIYALIVPYLSYDTVPAFTASCKEFRKLFWDNIDLTENNCLPLRRAVMRGALTSLKTMLPRFRGVIPVTVLKLAILAGPEVAKLLLQYDVEIDECCLAFAVSIREPELFEIILQKATRPILHSEYIYGFLLPSHDTTEKFVAIARKSPQFRTLRVSRNMATLQFEKEFPEFDLYQRHDADVPQWAMKSKLQYMGLGPDNTPIERIARVREIKRNIEANWTVSDPVAYTPTSGSPAPNLELIPPASPNNMELLGAVWSGDISVVKEIIARPETQLEYPQKLYLFQEANVELSAFFFESGFIDLTTEVVAFLYRKGNIDLLRPLWLKGGALPTPELLHKYFVRFWFFELATQVCCYWNDVKSEIA